ncbi:MAG: type II toxin-antitoxin system YafQ family toxin [Candidatus Peregrinibacteria bacterium]
MSPKNDVYKAKPYQKLETAIDLLASGEIPSEYRDHPLKGLFENARECHIAPDWLLMYTKDHEKLILLLLRTGTHRDVLRKE